MSTFQPGDAVVIRATQPMFHSRLPAYATGRTGVVERVLPDFVIPEDDAYGRLWDGGRRETLCRVRLRQADIWPDHRGGTGDLLELELFESYLTAEKEAVPDRRDEPGRPGRDRPGLPRDAARYP